MAVEGIGFDSVAIATLGIFVPEVESAVDPYCLSVEGVGFASISVSTAGIIYEEAPALYSEVDPYCLSVEGIGFGTISIATAGIIYSDREPPAPPVVHPVGGPYGKKKKPEPYGERITIRVEFMGTWTEKHYLVIPITGKVTATLKSHKRSSTGKHLKVEATKL